jgi:MFS family permease
MDRRALSLVSLLTVASSGVALLALSAAGTGTALPLYAAQALAGVGRAFLRPSTQALATELVPRDHYLNAATWRTTAFHLTQVVGPAVGGGLIAVGGTTLAYAVVVALAAMGLGGLLTVARRPRTSTGGGSIFFELADGVRFVFRHPLLLAALSLDLFAVLFGGATALLPVFARDVLGVGAVGFGFLRTAPAIGSVAMSIALSRAGPFRRAGPALLWCVAFFGISWIAFALSGSYELSILLLAVGGALDAVSVVLRHTLVQMETPQDKMGRVAAVNGFFIGSSNELGAFESGVAARLLGTVASVVFGGTMTLVTVAVVAWRAPALRRLRTLGGH